MNEVWRLTIEIMDHESIEALSRTNTSFQAYIKKDSEYIYRKLIEKEFGCIKGYKELYLVLKNSDIKKTAAYKKKCRQEGLQFDCDNLLSELNAFSDGQRSVSRQRFMNMVNTAVNCLDTHRKNRTDKAQKYFVLIGTLNNMMNNTNSDVKNMPWYSIVMQKLQDLHTPKSRE